MIEGKPKTGQENSKAWDKEESQGLEAGLTSFPAAFAACSGRQQNTVYDWSQIVQFMTRRLEMV